MTSLDFDHLSGLVSAERLGPYLREAKGCKPLAAEIYQWNIEIGAAFWDLLVYLEVAVRNAMAREMQDLRSRGSRPRGPTAYWYNNNQWFTSRQRAMIRAAKADATKKGLTPGRVVAQLMFGFWVSLLDPGHTHTLWVPALRNAFPNSPGDSKAVSGQLKWANSLRNEIAHHDRLYERDLLQAEEKVIRTAYWVDSRLADWMAAASKVRMVNAQRPLILPSARWSP